MMLLWKSSQENQNLYSKNRYIFCYDFWSIMNLNMRKMWAFIWHQESTTSSLALGEDRVFRFWIKISYNSFYFVPQWFHLFQFVAKNPPFWYVASYNYLGWHQWLSECKEGWFKIQNFMFWDHSFQGLHFQDHLCANGPTSE